MNEATNEAAEPATNEASGGVFDGATVESGGEYLDSIVSRPPKPEPVLLEHRSKAGDADGTPASDAKGAADASGEATNEPVLRVDPKDYASITDHKGRPFDPSMHQVNAEGKPVFNARGKVKMLKEGSRNPVRLILDSLIQFEEPERPQDECEAQAAVQVSEESMRMNAECLTDLYGATGRLAVGNRFKRGWKERRLNLMGALIQYERRTGNMMQVSPLFILGHAFVMDITLVSGAEMFDTGGGLLGWWQKLRMKRIMTQEVKRNEGGEAHAS